MLLQIRSHTQKYFLKVQKNGTTAHVPPPRPKRKASHPYPQKASKNGCSILKIVVIYFFLELLSVNFILTCSMGLAGLIPLQGSLAYPSSMNAIASGYCPWDEASMFLNAGSDQIVLSHEEFMNRQGTEGKYSLSYVFLLIYVLVLVLIMGYAVTDSADIGSKGVATISLCDPSGIGSSSRSLPSSEITKQGSQAPVSHGKPLLRS